MNVKILVLIVLSLFFSCKDKNRTETKEYFYKKKYSNNRVDYSFRKYEYINDTLKEKVIRFNSLGELINNDGDRGIYLKTEKGLFLLQGKKSPKVKGLVYTTKVKDTCVEYFHPYYHEIENCYKGLSKGNYVINSSQMAIDGFDYTLYLDKDYGLVRKKNNDSIRSKFREEIRIDKSNIPINVLDSINFYLSKIHPC